MRPIKFRAWDGVNMIYPDWLATHESGKYWQVKPNYNYDAEEYPLMQFTGLRDKNGKEIYEGDIIKTKWRVVEKGLLNKWESKVCPPIGPESFHWYSELEDMVVEIIGNIYENENPELLK